MDLVSAESLSLGLRAGLRHNPAMFLPHDLDYRILRLGGFNLVGRFPGHLRLSHALILFHPIVDGIVIHLLILRHIPATLWVNIVAEHILSVDITTDHRVDIAHAIGMKSWLAEVGRERGVWEPPGGALEVLSGGVWPHFLFG